METGTKMAARTGNPVASLALDQLAGPPKKPPLPVPPLASEGSVVPGSSVCSTKLVCASCFGHGADVWPRPGRILAAARTHSFAQLAQAIDLAFGRWDLAPLHMFTLADHTGVSPLEWWEGEEPDGSLDGRTTTLSRLKAGEQFELHPISWSP
jgi:hypothetical protein